MDDQGTAKDGIEARLEGRAKAWIRAGAFVAAADGISDDEREEIERLAESLTGLGRDTVNEYVASVGAVQHLSESDRVELRLSSRSFRLECLIDVHAIAARDGLSAGEVARFREVVQIALGADSVDALLRLCELEGGVSALRVEIIQQEGE